MQNIKIYSFLSLFLFINVISYAQSKNDNSSSELVILKSGRKQVLKKAKAEKKMIMLQFFTDNCDACAQMDHMIKTNTKLSHKIAKYFVLFRPEEGSKETKSLIKKYHINSYPTVIFMSKNSEVLHKSLGAISESEMLEMLDNVYHGVNTLSYFNTIYNNQGNKMGSIDLFNYAKVQMNAGEDYSKIAQEYFKKQNSNDLSSDENIEAIMLFTDDMYSHEFDFLVRNMRELESQKYSRVQIAMKVEDVISSSIILTLEESPDIAMVDTLSNVLSYFEIEDRDPIISRVEMDYFDFVKPDKKMYLITLDHYMATHLQILSSSTIADKAERVLSETDDRTFINNALMWVNEAMMSSPEVNEDLMIVFIKLLVKDKRYQEAGNQADMLYQYWLDTDMDKKVADKKYDELTKNIERKTEINR